MDPAPGGFVMRLTDLWNAKIKTLDGETLGRVHDVHVDGGRIIALACGTGGLIERLTARSRGRTVPWECVARIANGEIFVTPEPPKRKASATRSRQGTRRPSAPRSRR
jgi:sporulation protein YlmC with PRC-barrel domain